MESINSLPKVQQQSKQIVTMQSKLTTILELSNSILTKILSNFNLNTTTIKQELQDQSIFKQDTYQIENKLMAIQMEQMSYFVCLISHILISGDPCNDDHKIYKLIIFAEKLLQKISQAQDFRTIQFASEVTPLFFKQYKIIIKIQKLNDLQVIDFSIQSFRYNSISEQFDQETNIDEVQQEIQKKMLQAVKHEHINKKKKQKRKQKKVSKQIKDSQESQKLSVPEQIQINQSVLQQLVEHDSSDDELQNNEQEKLPIANPIIQQKIEKEHRLMKRFISNIMQDFVDAFNQLKKCEQIQQINEKFQKKYDFSDLVFQFLRNQHHGVLMNIRNLSSHQWTKQPFTQSMLYNFVDGIRALHSSILQQVLSSINILESSQEILDWKQFLNTFEEELNSLLF